jgi:hypothetical protein
MYNCIVYNKKLLNRYINLSIFKILDIFQREIIDDSIVDTDLPFLFGILIDKTKERIFNIRTL